MRVCVYVWTDWWRGGLESVQSEPRPRDVYLGGTCGQSSWREDFAIPELLYVLSFLHSLLLVVEQKTVIFSV